MNGSASEDDETTRLLHLSEEVTRIAAALARLPMSLAAAPSRHDNPPNSADMDISVRPMDRIFHARWARARYLPEILFSEPAWDMLLDLFRCELRGRRLSTSDLCLAAGVPGTTALRWISTMVQYGLVVTVPDQDDGGGSS